MADPGWVPCEGDVVCLWLESEQVSVTAQVEDEEARVTLKPFRDIVDLAADPTAQFFAFKRGDYVGFKSAKTGKFLQARRRKPHRLGTYSEFWGVWEQFRIKKCSKVVSSKVRGWKSSVLLLQPRQLPNVVISLGVYFLTTSAASVRAPPRYRAAQAVGGKGIGPEAKGFFSIGLIQDFARKVSTRSLRAAVTSWREAVRRTKLHERVSTSLLKSHSNRVSSSALRAWRQRVARKKNHGVFVQRLLAKTRRRTGAACLSQWRKYADRKKADAYHVKKFKDRHSRQRATSVLKEWKNYSERKGDAAARLQNCSRKMQAQKKRRIMREWSSNLTNRKLQKQRVDRIIALREEGSLREILLKWSILCEREKHKRSQRSLIQKIMNRQRLHHSFDHWSSLVQECVEVRLKLERCIVRMSLKHLCDSFEAWLAYTADKRAKVHLMHVAQQRMQRLHVSQCFETWLSNVDYLKQVRRKLQRCLIRYTHRCLAISFECWLDFTLNARFIQCRLKHAVRKLDRLCLWHFFGKWCVCVDNLRDDRAVLRKVILRMQRLHVSQCFETWLSNVDYLKQVRRKLHRCLMRMAHASLVHCFEAWVGFVSEQHIFAAACGVADKHRQRFLVAGCFLKWWKLVRFVKSINVSLLNRNFRSVLLHSCFTGWFMICRKSIGDESVAQRYLFLSVSRKKLVYFKKWTDYANFRKRKATLSNMLFGRYLSLLARRGFRAWCIHVELVNDKRANVRTFIVHWQVVKARKCFRSWQSYIDMVKMEAKLGVLLLRGAFEMWRMTAINSKARHSAVDNLLYTKKVRLSHYFRDWRILVAKEKLVLKRFVLLAKSRMKSSYLKHWLKYKEFKKSKRNLSNRLVLRYKFKIVQRCYKTWVAHVALQVDRRLVVKRFMERWSLMSMQGHFTCWAAKVARKKFILKKISLSGREQDKRALLGALRHWKNLLDCLKKQRSKVEGYIMQNRKAHGRKFLHKQFLHWRSLKPVREKMATMLQERHSAKLRSGSFKHWRAVAAEKVRLSTMMRDQHNQKIRVKFFESWHSTARKKAAFRRYRQKQKWFLRWKLEVSLRESYYEESSVLDQVKLGLEEPVEVYYPDLLRSSYTKAVEDVDVLEARIASMSQVKSKGVSYDSPLRGRRIYAESVLDDTEALLNELEGQSSKIRSRLAAMKSP